MPGLEVTFQSTARLLACRTLWELPIAFLRNKVVSKQLEYPRDTCHTHDFPDPDGESDGGGHQYSHFYGTDATPAVRGARLTDTGSTTLASSSMRRE